MRPLVLPIVAVALVLSGCSGASSQEGSDDGASDATTEQAEPTADTDADTDSDQQAASDGGAASSIPDPCEMFSADEMSEIVASAGFDLSFSDVSSGGEGGENTQACVWLTDTFSSVSVVLADINQDASEVVSHAGVTTQATDLDLPGIDAAWQTADGTTVQFAADTLVGTVIMVAMNDSGADTADATAAIAEQVAANL